MRDGSSLLKILAEKKHARAYIYGHTHEWQHDQRDHLHLINLPAVSYYFGKGHAWVDMKLTKTSADLELHCIEDTSSTLYKIKNISSDKQPAATDCFEGHLTLSFRMKAINCWSFHAYAVEIVFWTQRCQL